MKIGYLMQLGAEIRMPPFNGPANHVRHVVSALEARGHQVNVLFRLNNQIWLSQGLTTFIPVEAGVLDHGPFRWLERFVRRIQAVFKLPYLNLFESIRFAAACRQCLPDVDLFYERTSWMGYGGALAARRTGIPLVLEDNGDHLDDLEAKGIAPQGLQRKISLALMNWAVRQAAYVISSGQGWRQRFIERWGFQEDKIAVVENGTDLLHILTREQLKCFRQDPIQDGPIKLVYLGGFYPWHGVPILLRALARARQQQAPLELLLIGAGEGQAEAEHLSQELQITEAVTFAGHQPQNVYAHLLADANVGTSPYCGWPEYSGLKIFDYKAAGLPTLASGVAGNPVTIKTGETGWIVPPCDEDALVDILLELDKQRTKLRTMGQAARIEAETLHDWQHTVQRLETIFGQLLSQECSSLQTSAQRNG
ncbi:MAG: glycosyltransferase family 4 protein [Anaerolineales bacterium]|jgi:glycosyltransferase involved in cell wall biosynthesis